MQKNEKIDILSLIFMPFTGNKSPGAKKGSDKWQYDNFTNIFWVKRSFTQNEKVLIFAIQFFKTCPATVSWRSQEFVVLISHFGQKKPKNLPHLF